MTCRLGLISFYETAAVDFVGKDAEGLLMAPAYAVSICLIELV